MATDKDNNQTKIGNGDYLEFEDRVADFDAQMGELRRLSSMKGIDYSTEIRQLQLDQVAELKRVYSQLSAWQTVQVARHPKRPLLPSRPLKKNRQRMKKKTFRKRRVGNPW